jgi:hypothetical protein
MTTLETRIRVERSAEDVFDYVSDPRNFPSWNSAVRSVSLLSAGGADGVGATYSMRRELPTGPADNVLEVVAHARPRRFGIRTISGPTPFAYEFRFVGDGSGTVVDAELRAELGGVAGLLGPLARVALQRGVKDNLAALERLLSAR